jgi:hypothetical protein
MTTLDQIAQAWGCSRQAVGKWKKKGMPVTSIESATAWRLRNGQRIPKVALHPAMTVSALPDPMLEMAQPVGEPGSASAMLDRAIRTAHQWYATYLEKRSSGEFLPMVQAHQRYEAASDEVRKCRSALHKQHQEEKRLVPADVAMEEINKALGPWKSALEAMPTALSKRVNPDNPGLAHDVLTEEVQKILRLAQND